MDAQTLALIAAIVDTQETINATAAAGVAHAQRRRLLEEEQERPPKQPRARRRRTIEYDNDFKLEDLSEQKCF